MSRLRAAAAAITVVAIALLLLGHDAIAIGVCMPAIIAICAGTQHIHAQDRRIEGAKLIERSLSMSESEASKAFDRFSETYGKYNWEVRRIGREIVRRRWEVSVSVDQRHNAPKA